MADCSRTTIVKLSGGLGNQMFQLAAGYALARRLRHRLLLDRKELDDSSDRGFELDGFGMPRRLLRDVRSEAPVLSAWLNSPWVTAFPKWFGMRFVTQTGIGYDPVFAELTARQIILQGYWQSPRYFEDVSAAVRRMYRFRHPADRLNCSYLEQITNTTAVCLHVRRGDYVAVPETNKVHGICEADYYQAAVARLKSQINKPLTLFVFSDDLTAARQMLPDSEHVVFVVAANENRPVEELRLMASCQHFILANSSFSWWAGWLGTATNKIVIAPQTWYADPEKNLQTGDLIPPTWLRLSGSNVKPLTES